MIKQSKIYGLFVFGFCWLITHAQIQAQIPLTGVLSLEDRQYLSKSFTTIDAYKSHIWPNWLDTPKDIVIQNEQYWIEIKSRPISNTSDGLWALQFNHINIFTKRSTISQVHTLVVEGKAPQIMVSQAFFEHSPRVLWLGTLAHEHFHQWQMSRPSYFDALAKLSINENYPDCQWMFDYNFPFHQDKVSQILAELGSLHARESLEPKQKMDVILGSLFQLKSILSSEDWDYLVFQIWQEGIARYVEYAFLNELLKKDKETESGDGSLKVQLEAYMRQMFGTPLSTDDAIDRNIFYKIGLEIGLVLEQQPGLNWKEIYATHPVSLAFLGVNPTLSVLK